MDRTALIAELDAGKTISDVAKAKNVAVSKIADAMVANRTALLKAAVDAKRITPAQMEVALAALKTRVTTQIDSQWSPRGSGLGSGYGMGLGFADANKDGVCDNCSANRPRGRPFSPGGRWNR